MGVLNGFVGSRTRVALYQKRVGFRWRVIRQRKRKSRRNPARCRARCAASGPSHAGVGGGGGSSEKMSVFYDNKSKDRRQNDRQNAFESSVRRRTIVTNHRREMNATSDGILNGFFYLHLSHVIGQNCPTWHHFIRFPPELRSKVEKCCFHV